MDEELTLATPEDANIETNAEETVSQEVENNVEEPETDEYDKVWDSEDDTTLEESIDEISNDNNVDEQETSTEPEINNSVDGVVITRPLKYKGKEIFVNSEDEALALMQKGLDYEQKMTRIKPFRTAIDIIDENGIEPADVKALADIKGGSKDALDYLAKKYNLKVEESNDKLNNLFDEEPTKQDEANYEPTVDESVNDPVKEYWEQVSNEKPDVAGKTLTVWNEIDPTFQQELWNKDVFPAFVGSVETGEFERVYPTAIKVKAINPALTWLQAYSSAMQELVNTDDTKEPTEVVERKSTKKRSAVNDRYDDYDSVWDSDTSIDELEQQLFKG